MGKKLLITLHIILILIAFTYAHAKENIWVTFVNEPNESHYKICQQQVKDSLSGKYEDFKSPTYLNLMEDYMIGNVMGSVLGKVTILMDEGNIFALNLGFQIYPLFLGAEAELLTESLGKWVKKNPELYLTLVKKYKTNFIGYNSYGDEFVDDIDAKIQETQERIEALQKVHKKELQKLRDQCIASLKAWEINLQKEKKDMESEQGYAATLCAGDEATIECLMEHVNELYPKDVVWKILDKASRQAQNCNSFSDATRFMKFIHIINDIPGAVVEGFSENLERFCISNTKCFFDALITMTTDDQNKIVDLLSRRFALQSEITEAFSKVKGDKKYKRINDRYWKKLEERNKLRGNR